MWKRTWKRFVNLMSRMDAEELLVERAVDCYQVNNFEGADILLSAAAYLYQTRH